MLILYQMYIRKEGRPGEVAAAAAVTARFVSNNEGSNSNNDTANYSSSSRQTQNTVKLNTFFFSNLLLTKHSYLLKHPSQMSSLNSAVMT